VDSAQHAQKARIALIWEKPKDSEIAAILR
jgi:hypothetical protein